MGAPISDDLVWLVGQKTAKTVRTVTILQTTAKTVPSRLAMLRRRLLKQH